jgi:hypothetical protein
MPGKVALTRSRKAPRGHDTPILRGLPRFCCRTWHGTNREQASAARSGRPAGRAGAAAAVGPRLPHPTDAQHGHPTPAATLVDQLRGGPCLEPHQRPPPRARLRRVPRRGGVLPTAAQKASGDALAATLQASAAQIGVHYLVWYGCIWSVERAADGWRPYNGGGVYHPGDITGGHYDHLHISVQ